MRTLMRRSSLYKSLFVTILLILYCILIQVFAIKNGLSTNPLVPVPTRVLPGLEYAFPEYAYMGSFAGAYESQRWEEIRRAQYAIQFPVEPLPNQPLRP